MPGSLHLTIPLEPGPLPAPAAMSAWLREFAEPLLYVDPNGPADVETLRTAMMLAMICWNLPVHEATQSPLFDKGKTTLQAVEQKVSKQVASALRRLIDDRKTKFAHLPFLAIVEVNGATLQDATIVAEARFPTRRS